MTRGIGIEGAPLLRPLINCESGQPLDVVTHQGLLSDVAVLPDIFHTPGVDTAQVREQLAGDQQRRERRFRRGVRATGVLGAALATGLTALALMETPDYDLDTVPDAAQASTSAPAERQAGHKRVWQDGSVIVHFASIDGLTAPSIDPAFRRASLDVTGSAVADLSQLTHRILPALPAVDGGQLRIEGLTLTPAELCSPDTLTELKIDDAINTALEKTPGDDTNGHVVIFKQPEDMPCDDDDGAAAHAVLGNGLIVVNRGSTVTKPSGKKALMHEANHAFEGYGHDSSLADCGPQNAPVINPADCQTVREYGNFTIAGAGANNPYLEAHLSSLELANLGVISKDQILTMNDGEQTVTLANPQGGQGTKIIRIPVSGLQTKGNKSSGDTFIPNALYIDTTYGLTANLVQEGADKPAAYSVPIGAYDGRYNMTGVDVGKSKTLRLGERTVIITPRTVAPYVGEAGGATVTIAIQ